MANKRMFTMKIVDSDAFLDMPLSSQCLYFHLNMRADDDGFVDNPKRIIKIVGASEDDLKLLIVKHFLLCFENGVIVIKHWRMHNTLSKGRYHETQYTDEKASLKLKNNGSYSLNNGGKIDDTNLIEMFSGEQTENKRRTNGEQMENADIDLELDKDKGIDKELEEEKENSVNTIYSCSELKDLAHEQQQPVIEIILNDKSLYPIYQKDIDEWFELYPAVDVIQELRKMKDWCNSNPQKRKTKGGVRRFISGWLSKAQDRGGTHNTGNAYIDSIKNRISEVDNWK